MRVRTFYDIDCSPLCTLRGGLRLVGPRALTTSEWNGREGLHIGICKYVYIYIYIYVYTCVYRYGLCTAVGLEVLFRSRSQSSP